MHYAMYSEDYDGTDTSNYRTYNRGDMYLASADTYDELIDKLAIEQIRLNEIRRDHPGSTEYYISTHWCFRADIHVSSSCNDGIELFGADVGVEGAHLESDIYKKSAAWKAYLDKTAKEKKKALSIKKAANTRAQNKKDADRENKERKLLAELKERYEKE